MGRTKKYSRATLPAGISKVLKRPRYPLDVILLCVRWYVAYSLRLRDLEEMMAERGIEVDHSSVHQWVVKLVPLLEKAFRRVKHTVDFLLRAQRDKAAARRYFEKAIAQNGEPEIVTVDKSGANLAALEALNAGRPTPVKIR